MKQSIKPFMIFLALSGGFDHEAIYQAIYDFSGTLRRPAPDRL